MGTKVKAALGLVASGMLAAGLWLALRPPPPNPGVLVIFPLFVISGTLVPVESMPRAIQLVSYLSPVRYYLEIGLGVFLKGVGPRVLWPQILAMTGLGVAIFGLGLWRFGRQVR